MNVSIVGSGYVGTTVAACLADAGPDVVNIDIDESTVAAINDGDSPIHEPGLDELNSEHGGDRLRATTDYDAVRETTPRCSHCRPRATMTAASTPASSRAARS